MFEKAERKVEEYTFFFHQLKLCETQDPNATEFFFNALLNAGKNVVYALCAQVYTCESTCLPCDKAKKKAKQACTDHIKAWKRTRGGFHPTLFDVLQDVRDIETHADRSAVDYLSKTEERRRLRDIPSEPHYAAVFINYQKTGQLSPYVTESTITYDLRMDPAVSSKKGVQERLKAFNKRKPESITEVATTYMALLESLVAYFREHYAPPSSA